MRNMKNTFHGVDFYSSTFDPKTGVIVRDIEVTEGTDSFDQFDVMHATIARVLGVYEKAINPPEVPAYSNKYQEAKYIVEKDFEAFLKLRDDWEERYGIKRGNDWIHLQEARQSYAWSPVPETIDVKITDWCNFGCDFCYMSSTKKGKHAPPELIENIITGFDQSPYQIAFGGGEPCAHPEFPHILKTTAKVGSVPNYTTAGHIFREDVIKATNEDCGGVAITYHAWAGLKKFVETYTKWDKALRPGLQRNVHVIADNNVAANLLDLMNSGLRNLNIVLLAYYSDVGFAQSSGHPSKYVYNEMLPRVIAEVQEKANFRIAFSEGLVPYFMSRDIEGVGKKYMTRQEGLFSLYVDDQGFCSHSSFAPVDTDLSKENEQSLPYREKHLRSVNLYSTSIQEIWDRATFAPSYSFMNGYSLCDQCEHQFDCHAPAFDHFMMCGFNDHNKIPSKRPVEYTPHPDLEGGLVQLRKKGS